MKQNRLKMIPGFIVLALLLAAAKLLLGRDTNLFLTWWLLAGLLGLIAMPLTGWLFSGFEDKGWIFSKVLSIALIGYLEWFLVTTKVIPFTSGTCVGLMGTACLAGVAAFLYQGRQGIECLPAARPELVLWEEVFFFAVFLIWTYLAGFNPAAYGTEKFMDYGFMEAMMRSATLPARDLWYSEGVINYYYGGQYFAVFLTKLSFSHVEKTYNLMRTFIAGFAFTMPFSLVYQMTVDKYKAHRVVPFAAAQRKSRTVPYLAGIAAGFAVCFAGNVHYCIYRWILPLVQKLQGAEPSGYWFPDATRYIGHNPDRPDKTIHEFPCYSFILGDLHAHVVNILFVLLMIGVLYAWFQRTQKGEEGVRHLSAGEWKKRLFSPYLLLAGFLLGLYQLNNYWDFVIYVVVASGTALFINLKERLEKGWWVALSQAVLLFVEAKLIAVPFAVLFETMVDGVALAKYHSLFYQLLVLWGLPLILGGLFTVLLVRSCHKSAGRFSLALMMGEADNPDLFAVLLFVCAFGLILIPELVYVRDIYENGNARANTMFKLTYQAYMMLGVTMGYVIFRMLAYHTKKLVKAVYLVGLGLLCWTVGYFGNCVGSWYGNYKTPEYRLGLNATEFLQRDFPEDVGAIHWLKANIPDSPVVLEANGDSYTGYERVSAMTGLPTVLGWYVHEWLWRNNTDDLGNKVSDVEAIYTSQDNELVRHLLKAYDISYIFVGSMEREKYGDRLNRDGLLSLGEVVYRDENYDTWIVRVQI